MINQENYEELKKDFLSRDYGNVSYDHPQYMEYERAYKDELIGIFRGEVSDAIHHKTFQPVSGGTSRSHRSNKHSSHPVWVLVFRGSLRTRNTTGTHLSA